MELFPTPRATEKNTVIRKRKDHPNGYHRSVRSESEDMDANPVNDDILSLSSPLALHTGTDTSHQF